MEKTFSHLRVSSEYSITQGLLTINQLVDCATKHSVPSLALTDKSNMFAMVKFFNKCENAGIKPISGSSIRVIFDGDDSSHELLCLAKNNNGHKSLMTALESPKVKSMMVTLVQNITNLQNKTDKAVKATVDFLNKGLKYAIAEHNKGLKGTKWDGTTVRTDSMDKWKNCKEVGKNVEMGFFGGLLKCSPLVGTGPGMFICAGAQASLELLDPDTAWCIVEINKFVDETEVMGDCTIF